MIAEVMVWVVLTGIPHSEAISRTVAAAVSAAKPWTRVMLASSPRECG